MFQQSACERFQDLLDVLLKMFYFLESIFDVVLHCLVPVNGGVL